MDIKVRSQVFSEKDVKSEVTDGADINVHIERVYAQKVMHAWKRC